jgi:hypothetical protein
LEANQYLVVFNNSKLYLWELNNLKYRPFDHMSKINSVEKEKKAEAKRKKAEIRNRSEKPLTAEEDFKFSFLVNSSHIQRWRDCDIKTAQRRLRKIKKHYGIQNGKWLTFKQVADYEGWNSQQLLEEMQTRRLKIKERHKEKV